MDKRSVGLRGRTKSKKPMSDPITTVLFLMNRNGMTGLRANLKSQYANTNNRTTPRTSIAMIEPMHIMSVIHVRTNVQEGISYHFSSHSSPFC